jgi:hypothetical protein
MPVLGKKPERLLSAFGRLRKVSPPGSPVAAIVVLAPYWDMRARPWANAASLPLTFQTFLKIR